MIKFLIASLREVTDLFQEFCNVKYFKEIKRLKSLQKAEVYLEPERASTMESFFVNMLNGLLFSH